MLRRLMGVSALFLLLGGLAGCGGTSRVEGVVTLDGTPVKGATVTFMPQDPSGQPAAGQTDDKGVFVLTTNGKPGAMSGSYKVTVIKTEILAGMEEMKPGDPKAMEEMKKKMAKGGPMMPNPGATPKGALPGIYGAPMTTPFTFKVPLESSPVKLELKSKQ